ncbi:MAG: hypothetical protein KatS3mg002_0872 [Candidatus Woesearchaeota archaeon]|nr:MAG: hypothetical protein KatS3mg002_0872 [Candidatus Woesearchaeota archaeon]
MITLRGTHVSYLRDNYVEYLKSNTFPRKNSIYPNGNTYLDKLLTDLINNPNENVFCN